MNKTYIKRNIILSKNKCNNINQIKPHCGTIFIVFYDNNRRIMIGKTESNPIENEIYLKINKELLNCGFTPDDIIIFPFTKKNIIMLMDKYPNYPTVSQYDKYLKSQFTQSVYKKYPIKSKLCGNYNEHFGRIDNHPIDLWQMRSFFLGLGFDWDCQNYWYFEKNRDYTILTEEIF